MKAIKSNQTVTGGVANISAHTPDLYAEILAVLSLDYNKHLTFSQIAPQITTTRHHSRIRLALDEMVRRGLITNRLYTYAINEEKVSA
ncbi:MAG: hypothetical protein WCS28_12795 [Thiomicrospira sp.]